MKNILIVYAHEEPTSFNGVLMDHAVSVLSKAGYQVEVSDLYKMNFQAVGNRNDFLEITDATHYKYQNEQRKAYDTRSLSVDILREQEKIKKADLIIFQFPLWWASMPAIMKGWIDRVFTPGFTYGGGKWFDKGGLKGKKAMLSLTTGGGPNFFSTHGIYGDLQETLKPIHYGILFFVGLSVLPPFVVYSPARLSEEQGREYLATYKNRLLSWENTEEIHFPTLDEYDKNFQRKEKQV